MLIIDDTFPYTDVRYPLSPNCECRLRVWDRGALGHIVMATDDGRTQRGASVTNTCEAWARDAVKMFSMDPGKTLFVEHYRYYNGRETYDLVRFDWDQGIAKNPKWSATSKRAIEIMVGENIRDDQTKIEGAKNV